MKKITLICLACMVLLSAVFLSACGDGNDDKNKKTTGTTYTLAVGDIAVYLPASGTTNRTIEYTLTASDGVTDGIVVSFFDSDDNSGITFTGRTMTIPAATETGEYTINAEAIKGSEKVATATFKVTVAAASSIPSYSVTVTVTLGTGTKAQLEEGEFLWVVGSWISSWDDSATVLTKQANGTWTGTIADVAAGTASFEYQIYAVESDTVFDWSGIKPSDNNQWFYYSSGNTTANLTVTEWLGRPISYPGNLFVDFDFFVTGADNWSVNGTAWDFDGLNGVSEWLIQGPAGSIGPMTGTRCFWDYRLPDPNENALDNDATLTITQDVDAATLSAGDSVTMSTWIRRVNANQKDFAFICGAQTFALSPTTSTDWQELTHTFTLTAADITDGAVNAGLKYTATTGNCRTGIDLLALVKE